MERKLYRNQIDIGGVEGRKTCLHRAPEGNINDLCLAFSKS